MTSEVPFAGFEYLSKDEILLADTNARLTLVRNIRDKDAMTINIFSTKVPRFKQIKAVPTTEFVVSISTDGTIAFWDLVQMRDTEPGLFSKLKPISKVKSVHRLLCLAINTVEPHKEQPKKGKTDA